MAGGGGGGLQLGRQLGGQPGTSADLLAMEKGQAQGNDSQAKRQTHIYRGQVLGQGV